MKSTSLRRAAIPSAAFALLLTTAGGADAARPTTPDACRTISEWTGFDRYPPESCVTYEKRVWANDRFAHPGQRPGVDHAIYFGAHRSPTAQLWFDIGEYVPPSATPDLLVSIQGAEPGKPVVYVVPNKEKTSVHFVTPLHGNTRHSNRPALEGEFSVIDVMAEDVSMPGRLAPVRLRAQRNMTGTGYDGKRVQIDGNGGPAGPGTLVVWYEPADNPRLTPGTRYRTPAMHRVNVQAVGNDLPNRPVLKTFSLGIDIVHRAPKATTVQFDGKQARFVLPLRTDQGRSAWYATTHEQTTGREHGTGHCPENASDIFRVAAVDENNVPFPVMLRAHKAASADGTGTGTTVACRLPSTTGTESLVFELRPEDNPTLFSTSVGNRIRNAFPYRIAVRNAAGQDADQSYQTLDIKLDMTVEKVEAVPPTVDPKEPKDPKDPVEPKTPVDPKDPTDPTGPTDPADPDPTDPADPTGPGEPGDPVKPADPADGPDVTPRSAVPAPKAGQLGGTYTQASIYQRNYLIRDVARSGAARKLTYLNYGSANLHRGEDGLYRCQSGDTRGPSDPFADYGKRFSATESVDGKADPAGKHVLRGNFNQILKLKQTYPVKTLISIGGPGLGDRFAQAARTEAGRNALAESCVDVYIKGNLAASRSSAGGKGLAKGVFDGINLEWLAPRAALVRDGQAGAMDWGNYLALVRAFRDALEREDSRHLLTSTMNLAESAPDARTAVAIAAELNWVNIQAYDFTGGWDASTGHAAALQVGRDSPWTRVQGMKQRSLMGTIWDAYEFDIPQEKQVFGVPFHGHGWTSVKPGRRNGLWMAGAPVRNGQGQRDYRDIKRMPNGKLFSDAASQAAWRYDGWTFWSYDTPAIVKAKVEAVRRTRAAGMYASDLGADDKAELINAMEPIKR